ncbi:MAG: hypothetical protein U0670_10475 [Anaerolineae bacterium]
MRRLQCFLLILFTFAAAQVQAQDTTPSLESYACISDSHPQYYSGSLYRLWDTESRLDGTRIVYQPYAQRIVLFDTESRTVLRVIQDQVTTTDFGYHLHSGCHLLIYQLAGREGTDTIFYDLQLERELLRIENDVIRRMSVDPSQTYVVIDTRNGSFLYNLNTDTHFPLIPAVAVAVLGAPDIWSYSGIEWDLMNGFVRVIGDYGYRDFDLNTGQLRNAVGRQWLSTGGWTFVPVTASEFALLEAQRTAPYGCEFRIRYQAYNQRLVLTDWLTDELIAIVEDEFPVEVITAWPWQSPDCRLIAANVRENGQDKLVVWDLTTLQRALEEPLGFTPTLYSPVRVDWSRLVSY